MALKVAKTIRFSKKEVAEVERIADEEGLTFSQIINKLTALGMAEFRQSRRYNLRELSSMPGDMPTVERKKTELLTQNTLMLERIVRSISGDDYQKTIKDIREGARGILRKEFLVPTPVARE